MSDPGGDQVDEGRSDGSGFEQASLHDEPVGKIRLCVEFEFSGDLCDTRVRGSLGRHDVDATDPDTSVQLGDGDHLTHDDIGIHGEVGGERFEPDAIDQPGDPLGFGGEERPDDVLRDKVDGDRADRGRSVEPLLNVIDDVDPTGASQPGGICGQQAHRSSTPDGDVVPRLKPGPIDALPRGRPDVRHQDVVAFQLGRQGLVGQWGTDQVGIGHLDASVFACAVRVCIRERERRRTRLQSARSSTKKETPRYPEFRHAPHSP